MQLGCAGRSNAAFSSLRCVKWASRKELWSVRVVVYRPAPAGAGPDAGAAWLTTVGQHPRDVPGYRLVVSVGQQLPTRPMASHALLAVHAALTLAFGSAALAVTFAPTVGGGRDATQNRLLDLDPPGPKPVVPFTCATIRCMARSTVGE